jgi:hypothetical protein
MRQAFDIELTDPDEQYSLVADSRDIRRWEAQFEASYLDGAFSFTKFAQLAYVAATRQGLYTGSWETFDARCTSAEGGDLPAAQNGAEPANPTDQEPTDGSSSPLASASASSPPS